MSFLHKFLSEDMANKTLLLCKVDCVQEIKDSGSCSSTCLTFCPSICEFVAVSGLSPPPVTHHKDLKKLLIIGASSIITSLFLVSLLVFCFKYYRSRRRSTTISRRWSMERGIDEASPAIIDHPIWHIRTIGLNPSIISSIEACRYSKEDGLVEGTDCSVCLSEFEEEETLRMLPKCRHAFHLSCIDTWLRSHTNCPLCRAPIVVSEALTPLEEISVGIDQEEDGETEEERDEFVSEIGRDGEVDEEEEQRVRRTMSLDSLSVIRVNREKEKPRSKQGASNVGSSIVGRSGFLKRSISSSQ